MKRLGTKKVISAAVPVLSLIAATGAVWAQQPIVARAALPLWPGGGQGDARPLMPPGTPEPPAPPQSSGAPMKDDLFAGTEKFAKNAKDVTEVDMDPDSLGMVGGSSAKRAHDVVLRVVKTYSYDKPGLYNPADVEEYRRKLETGDWHCSVHIRESNGEATDICSRRRAPDMVENAIITMEPRELTFIHTIKKANGQGSGVDLGSMPEMYMQLPSSAYMAMIEPEMMAEIKAQTAQMQAKMPELMESLKSAQQLGSAAAQEQMRKLQRQMESLREQYQTDKKNYQTQP